MFSFFRRGGDAFQQRRKQQDVWKSMSRLIDNSAPNLLHAEEQARTANRHNRSLPALIVPFASDEPQLNEAVFAVTRDCSDDGASLLSTDEVTAEHVICAFWDDGPVYLLGDIKKVNHFGAGFWQIGVRFSEVIPSAQLNILFSMAQQLVPQQRDDARHSAELAAGIAI